MKKMEPLKMSLSKKECYDIIHGSNMLTNIIYHSFKVSRIAEVITSYLLKKGLDLNLGSITKSALLHDITKTRSLKTKEPHALTGGNFLKELGYNEEGEIVRQHVTLDEYIFTGPPKPEEIVNYADKRVLHDEVVPLELRMSYIMERYGDDEEKIVKIQLGWENIRRIEEKIFTLLPFDPSELNEIIGEDDSRNYFEYITKREHTYQN